MHRAYQMRCVKHREQLLRALTSLLRRYRKGDRILARFTTTLADIQPFISRRRGIVWSEWFAAHEPAPVSAAEPPVWDDDAHAEAEDEDKADVLDSAAEITQEDDGADDIQRIIRRYLGG